MAPNTLFPNATQMMWTLSCDKETLQDLKYAVKREMESPDDNGRTLISQHLGSYDPNGTKRDKMWDRVTGNDVRMSDTLQDRRFETTPADFEDKLRKIKTKIVHDINSNYRRGVRGTHRHRGGSERGTAAMAAAVSAPGDGVVAPDDGVVAGNEANHGVTDDGAVVQDEYDGLIDPVLLADPYKG